MKKSKGEKIDLFYTSKNKPKQREKKELTKSNKKGKIKHNLNNEIIIGLVPKQDENKKHVNKKAKTKNNVHKTKGKISTKKTEKSKKNVKAKLKNEIVIGLTPKQSANKKTTTKKVKTSQRKEPSKTIKSIIAKCISISFLIGVIIVLFMMSSRFNIKEIQVVNNSKISSQGIIKLSGVTPEVNMFKITNRQIIKGIKKNAYIEKVHIKRKLNGVLIIEVEERIPTYMLKYANAYVYINNQGYILEVTEKPLELPVITGFGTPSENIKEGKRLINEDLKKLGDVIKIIESAKNNSLVNKITEINISDSNNYILTIASELKTVQFGDINNVGVKLLKIEALIEQEKGVAGEIYFQGTDRTIFKEEVKR